MTNLTARVFTRRDSATALLKKLGVDKADYNRFIVIDGDTFTVDPSAVGLAKMAEATNAVARQVRGKASAQGPDIDETEALAASKPAKKVKAVKAASASKRTVTSVAEAMIRAGKTNAEVWTAIQKEFNLDDAKRGYPAWYRRHLRVAKGEDYSATAGKAEKTEAAPKAKANKKAAATKPAVMLSDAAYARH